MEPNVSAYIGTNLVLLENIPKDLMFTKTVDLGVKVESDGYYAKAEGGLGKGIFAKAELGKDFEIGDGFGVNTSVGAQYIKSGSERDYYHYVYGRGANSPTWKPNETTGYAQASLTYSSSIFKGSVGIRGGIKSSSQASLDGITLAPAGEIIDTEYAGTTTKGYVTPVVNIEVGKNFKGTFEATSKHVAFTFGAKFNIFKN